MIYKPPTNITKRDHNNQYVFLAGTIENNTCIDWQKEMSEFFVNLNIGVFNPRHEEWDASWKTDYTNPQFYQQVTWELNALKHSDFIIMNFVAETILPISLLELGLYANSGKIFVISPKEYFRNGNIEIVCADNNIPLFDSLEEFKDFF